MMHDSEDEKLRPLLEQLPRSIEPAHDLWPAIAARLESAHVRRPHRRLVALAAAALIAVAGASSLATAWLIRRGEPAAVVATTAVGASNAIGPREAAYLRTTGSLTEELDRYRSELAPETVAVLERNLAIIDRAIAESRVALAADPANADLAELLWASYERKVSLLEQVARIATPI